MSGSLKGVAWWQFSRGVGDRWSYRNSGNCPVQQHDRAVQRPGLAVQEAGLAVQETGGTVQETETVAPEVGVAVQETESRCRRPAPRCKKRETPWRIRGTVTKGRGHHRATWTRGAGDGCRRTGDEAVVQEMERSSREMGCAVQEMEPLNGRPEAVVQEMESLYERREAAVEEMGIARTGNGKRGTGRGSSVRLANAWSSSWTADRVTGPADRVTGPADRVTGPADRVTGPADRVTGPIDHATGPADRAAVPRARSQQVLRGNRTAAPTRAAPEGATGRPRATDGESRPEPPEHRGSAARRGRELRAQGWEMHAGPPRKLTALPLTSSAPWNSLPRCRRRACRAEPGTPGRAASSSNRRATCAT